MLRRQPTTILTIFPHSVQREENGSISRVDSSPPQRTEAIVPVVTATSNTTATAESMILQKLLAELEARAISRAQAPYVVQQVPPVRGPGFVRVQSYLLWVLSVVLCFFVVKYVDREKTNQISDPAQSRSIANLTTRISDQNRQFLQMLDSVEHLASAVASSSMRSAAMLTRLGHDLKRANSPPPNQKGETGPSPVPSITPSSSTEALGENSVGGHHHEPAEDLVAMPNVVVHHNEKGIMDYWRVPRIVSGVRVMTKVVPVVQTAAGVFVHNVGEARDYIVTPSGDWLSASDPNANK
jgi:hypothetical protein